MPARRGSGSIKDARPHIPAQQNANSLDRFGPMELGICPIPPVATWAVFGVIGWLGFLGARRRRSLAVAGGAAAVAAVIVMVSCNDHADLHRTFGLALTLSLIVAGAMTNPRTRLGLEIPVSDSAQMDAAIQSLQLRAWSCGVTVRIARITGAAESSWKTGSGVLIEFPDGAVIATAWHILAELQRLRSAGETVGLVCDNMPIEDPQTVYRDEAADIAFIEVPLRGRKGLRAVPYRPGPAWPPTKVQPDDAVLLCGFPKLFRLDGAEILHGDFNLQLPVASVGTNYFTLQVDWKRLVQAGRIRIPREQADYGGVSGGPVFLWDGGCNPLVGIVSQAGETLPIWRIASFEGAGFDFRTAAREAV